MDASEPELFFTKWQETEAVSSIPRSGISNGSISLWDKALNFQSVSGQFSDCLFGSELVRSSNLIDRNTPNVGMGNLNMEVKVKGFEGQFGTHSSVSLSLSRESEDPSLCIIYGGIRKVRVNQAGDSENCMPVSYCTRDSNISIGAVCNMANDRISRGPTYNRGRENTISLYPTFTKTNDNFVSMGRTFNKGDGSFMLTGHNFDKSYDNSVSMSHPFDKGHAFVSAGQELEKGNGNIISAGHAHTKGRENNTGPTEIVAPGASSKTKATPKSKEPEPHTKVATNNFPSNVKSLLSTGMLDGVPVKYVSWSREHSLKGIVKGSGYLCGCKNCKFSKFLNAYELERHAGCKTKHPNNHIYFENGKTIYAVVQELKSTSQDMLFEIIQKVTGSPIHQKNFLTWKASYQAATRELQRIYGNDELTVAS